MGQQTVDVCQWLPPGKELTACLWRLSRGKKKKKAADAHFKAALTCLFHFQTVYSTQLEPMHQHRNKLTLEHIDRIN